jgi:hypothetical protein
MHPDGWGDEIPAHQNSGGYDFIVREIRVGEVVGARSFIADQDGNLMGVILKKHWTPGVNIAECWRPTGWDVPGVGVSTHAPRKKTDRRYTGRMTVIGGTEMPEEEYVHLGWSWTVDGVEGYSVEKPAPVYGNNDRAHDLTNCSCGLHGYMWGSLNFAYSPDSISGIVKAFGQVRMGERGFRATHATIAALYFPPALMTYQERGPRPDSEAPLHKAFWWAERGSNVTPEVVEKVRAKYDVPIYTDLDAMLADFPTEPPRTKE